MTVKEVVAQLKADGVRFSVEPGDLIRTKDRLTIHGWPCCPLAALMPEGTRTNSLDYKDMAALDVRNWREVIAAADEMPGHDPAIRALLLTLVEE